MIIGKLSVEQYKDYISMEQIRLADQLHATYTIEEDTLDQPVPAMVIQNLVENRITSDFLPLLYVTKNILQRGFPTTMSKYLQSELGEIHKDKESFEKRFINILHQIS